jgi:hypothetical protein
VTEYAEGWLAAADAIANPYPVEVFPELTEDEVRRIVSVMNEAFPYASERMHAQWARHWADVLRRELQDAQARK